VRRLIATAIMAAILAGCGTKTTTPGPTPTSSTASPVATSTLTTPSTASASIYSQSPSNAPSSGLATAVPTVSTSIVPVPTHPDSPPAGATAHCNDGTYSQAATHQGACSHHGGVAIFYK
jgi:hypothetical protein